MTGLPKPDLPPGPHRELVDALHDLYVASGAPSVRAIADQIGDLSRDTVHRTLTSARLPKHRTLEAVVSALGGDVPTFRQLWRAAAKARSSRAGPDQVEVLHSLEVEPAPTPERTDVLESLPYSGPLRVAIVDDHEIVRMGLRDLFESDDYVIAGTAATAAAGVRMVLDTHPDLVIMDVRLPDGNGIDATAELLQQRSDLRVLMLTSFDDDDAVQDSIAAGAAGFLLKQVTATDILAAARTIVAGQELWRDGIRPAKQIARPNRHDRGLSHGTAAPLSRQETRVLKLITKGLTNTAISDVLAISRSTVESHLTNVYRKLGVSSRTEALRYAIERQLV